MEQTPERKAYLKRYYQAHKEELREKNTVRMREWRKNNPDKVKESNHRQYLKRKEAGQV